MRLNNLWVNTMQLTTLSWNKADETPVLISVNQAFYFSVLSSVHFQIMETVLIVFFPISFLLLVYF